QRLAPEETPFGRDQRHVQRPTDAAAIAGDQPEGDVWIADLDPRSGDDGVGGEHDRGAEAVDIRVEGHDERLREISTGPEESAAVVDLAHPDVEVPGGCQDVVGIPASGEHPALGA